MNYLTYELLPASKGSWYETKELPSKVKGEYLQETDSRTGGAED